MRKKIIISALVLFLLLGLAPYNPLWSYTRLTLWLGLNSANAAPICPANAAPIQRIVGDGEFLLPVVAVSALVDSLNPCAFSILLLTIAFLFSAGKLRSDILKIGGAYIFGIFLMYLTIGLGILRAMDIFNMPHFMGKAGAALLIILGTIGLFNVFFPSFPIKLRVPQSMHKRFATLMERGSMPSAFALGGLVGIFEFPCTGGAYLMILGLLHDAQTYFAGLWYLLFYNAIFVSPLAAILFVASNKTLLEKMNTWRKERSRDMRLWSSAAMILLGALIFLLY